MYSYQRYAWNRERAVKLLCSLPPFPNHFLVSLLLYTKLIGLLPCVSFQLAANSQSWEHTADMQNGSVTTHRHAGTCLTALRFSVAPSCHCYRKEPSYVNVLGIQIPWIGEGTLECMYARYKFMTRFVCFAFISRSKDMAYLDTGKYPARPACPGAAVHWLWARRQCY